MTKKRRYLLSLAVMATCVAIVWIVLALLPPSPGVTKSNFDRIEDGMTIADVEQLFGKSGMAFHGFVQKPVGVFVWSDDAGSLAFVETEKQLVTSKKWQSSNESITEKVKRWLHLPK